MEATDNRMFHSEFLNQNGGHWSDQFKNQGSEGGEENNSEDESNGESQNSKSSETPVTNLNQSADSEDDNGYDKNGKQINKEGGDKTDYLYDENGNIIDSTPVQIRAISQGEFRELGGFRGYGVKGFAMATGAITEDNIIAGTYIGGKIIGLGLSYVGDGLNLIKVPVFKAIGQGIKTFAPKLGANRYLRIGLSHSRGREVFRITWSTRFKYLLDIDLGPIPKIKK